MFKDRICIYFKCDTNIDINTIPLNKLVDNIAKISKKYGQIYCVNCCITMYDLLFYRAVETYKNMGGDVINLRIKKNGRGGRKFDEYFSLPRNSSDFDMIKYAIECADICIEYYNNKFSIVTKL